MTLYYGVPKKLRKLLLASTSPQARTTLAKTRDSQRHLTYEERVQKGLLTSLLPSARNKSESGAFVQRSENQQNIKFKDRAWVFGEFPTSVRRPGRGHVEGGAAVFRPVMPEFKPYYGKMNADEHKVYQESKPLEDKPWDLGLTAPQYYKDGSTEWYKTLFPERNRYGGPLFPGRFGREDTETDKNVPVYALSEIDRSEYLDKVRGETYGADVDSDPFSDGYQANYTGMYKTELDALYEQPIDQDATCPPERFQALDRRMKYWIMITKTKVVKESDSAARDYENDNDPFNPQNTAFLKEYGLPLRRKVRKMIRPESGASPFDVAPPDFQDLVRMKRTVDFSERYHPTVRPWMLTSFSHYNPDDVPSYVGWSLFANMRHELEYHPEFHPTPIGAIYDSDDDDEDELGFTKPVPGSAYHKMKAQLDSKGDREAAENLDDEEQADAEEYNLDFFNTIHIKSNSVTKITSQGRVDGYAELVVAGNGRGCGAYGYGRGKTADEALDNAYTDVSKNLLFIPLTPDRNLWTNHLHAKDRKANIEIKSTIGKKDNKGGVLFVVMLELLGIRGATVKRYGSRNITSQIRAFFKALSLTGDIPAFSQNALVPVIPSPFYSNSAFVEPRNLRKVHDHAELIDNGFGYHPESVLVKNNLDRLIMMKKMKKEYMADQKRKKKPYTPAYGVHDYPPMKSALNTINLMK